MTYRTFAVTACLSLMAVAPGAAWANESPSSGTSQTTVAPTRWQSPLQSRTHKLAGDETLRLLGLQRSQQGQRPRPIDGDQAGRSYERYLKTFEHAIPESFEAGIDMKK